MPAPIPAANPRLTPRTPKGRVARGMALLGLLGLVACMEFPDLDNRLSETDQAQDFPRLVPAETLLEGTGTTAIPPETEASVQDRIDALNTRAEALRDTGLDADTRDRMLKGVQPLIP